MSSRAPSTLVASILAIACGAFATRAEANPGRILVLPTSVGRQLDCNVVSAASKPPELSWFGLARRIDGLISDAVEDAGMQAELRLTASSEAESSGCIDDVALRGMARQSPVLAPRVVMRDGHMILRIVVVAPNSSVLRLVTQEVSEKDLDFRVVVMVSEALTATSEHEAGPKPAVAQPLATTPAVKPRSQGKGVLALSSAVLGGAIGYSLQRASGSNDPRLTYPLIALGTGLGLGASLIAAEEWDLSVGEAWYLNAGMVWPTAAGMLLATSYDVRSEDRYVYGMVGATAGMSLASFALNFQEITEGGAVLTHSGGGFGLLLGGLTQMAYHGDIKNVPYRGMGFGSGIGVALAGAAATQLRLSSSRVVFIDLSAGLGALTGAAVGSSLLFLEDDQIVPTKRQRAWVSVVGAGAIIGGGIGWYLTRGWSTREHEGSGTARVWPFVSALPRLGAGSSESGGVSAGVQGRF